MKSHHENLFKRVYYTMSVCCLYYTQKINYPNIFMLQYYAPSKNQNKTNIPSAKKY